MSPPDLKPTEVEVRYSERFKRRAHRREIRSFFWGTWLVLVCAIGLAAETLTGLRTGEWVDIGVRPSAVLVPAWIAAALTAALFVLSLWCFSRYVRLKASEPTYQPGDEDDE